MLDDVDEAWHCEIADRDTGRNYPGTGKAGGLLMRSAIELQSIGPGPNGWYWGVCSPKPTSKMSEKERERREELDAALTRHGPPLADRSEQWPQWDRLSRYRDRDPLVPELYEECQAGGGPITDYHVNGLLAIASHATRVINEVEVASQAISGE